MADISKLDYSQVDWARTPHIQVGDRKHLSIYQAWNDIDHSKESFHFNLFDNLWENYNWQAPPTEDWDTLLCRRCLDIRSRFDWVRLWFSGGRDSHLVLESFIKNKIRLDELTVWYNPYDQQRGPEVELIIIPLLKKIKLSNPEIKITILDVRLEDYEKFYNNEYWLEQQLGHPGGTWLFYPGQNTTMFLRRPDLFPQRDQGLRDVNIFGMEKPRLTLEDGKWYSQLVEHSFAVHWAPNELTEMFYISPDMPELYAKQIWMLIDHIETKIGPVEQSWLYKYIAGRVGPKLYDDLSLAIGRKPYTHPSIGLGTNKGRDNRFTKLVDWAQKTNWAPYKHWHNTLEKLKAEKSDNWNHKYDHPTGILSKKIFIKDYDSGRFDPDQKIIHTDFIL